MVFGTKKRVKKVKNNYYQANLDLKLIFLPWIQHSHE